MQPPTIVAYSHESRADELRGTTAAFLDVGLPITYAQIQTEPPSQIGNRLNALAAIRHAIRKHEHGAGMLLIEDDIRPSPNLAEWLEVIAAKGELTTLYTPNAVTRYAPERLAAVMRGEQRLTVGELYPIQHLRGWWGAQALWIPWSWAHLISRHPSMTSTERIHGPWDTTLRSIVMQHEAELWGTAPSLVQHTGARNVQAPHRTPHMSASYDERTIPPAPGAQKEKT